MTLSQVQVYNQGIKDNIRLYTNLLVVLHISTFLVYVLPSAVLPTGGWQQGQFVPALSVRGPPNSVRLVQIRSSSSVTFQFSFFKVFVSLYFRLKPTCFIASRFMLLRQTSGPMHNNYLMWLLHSSSARAPYVVLFDLKPLIEDGNLQVYMYCSGVARTQPMPGHSVGTLRLRIASYPGPAQL